jgi:uncharacterized membrane protein
MIIKILYAAGIFCSGCVFTNNLSRLVEINPNYEVAWWKVVVAIVLGFFASLALIIDRDKIK